MMINVREFTNGYINTDTVQRAIDYAAENKKVLYFPAGIYRTSSLFLKSNSSLYLDENAVLSALTDEEDWKNSKLTPFIYGKDAENISLRGKGVICCNGRFFVGEKANAKKQNSDQNVLLLCRIAGMLLLKA